MPAFETSPSFASVDDYRRNARRLRARHGKDLNRLQRGLAELSRASDWAKSKRFAESRTRKVIPADIDTEPSGGMIFTGRVSRRVLTDLPLDQRARHFADMVAKSLSAGLLTYTSRSGLIRLAAEMGIRRFDANLVIALVQQRMGLLPMMQASSIDFEVESQSTLSPKVILLAAAVVQGLIVLSIWALTHLD